MTEKSIYANQTVVVQRGDRMEHEIDRIECAIRHIESSLDVDPWACEIAVNAMRELIKPSKPQRWIPVTEALPRDDEEVIVTCLDDSGDTPYSYTTVAWHYKGMWVCDNMRCPFVTAWMPLPEPYAERKEDE